MPFPIHRLRRLRVSEPMRNLVRETRLDPAQFILPLFVCPGEGIRREISSMPGNYQMSIDEIVKECAEVEALGIGGVILFGLPETKDEMASGAYDENGIVQRAIRAIKRESAATAGDDRRLQLRVHQPRPLRLREGRRRGQRHDAGMAGEIGAVARARRRRYRGALRHDGRPRVGDPAGARRERLRADRRSCPTRRSSLRVFYGPFREAAESTPQFGDRRSYQMDPANGREAMREIELDLEEGADMIMVKPALPYLDLICAGAASASTCRSRPTR